jgi:hypothetical protein
MSLLKANTVRTEFLRINRDITGTFGLLAAGEQLLVRTQGFWLFPDRQGSSFSEAECAANWQCNSHAPVGLPVGSVSATWG